MTRAALILNTRAGTIQARPDIPELVEAALRDAGFDLLVIGEDAAADLPGRLDLALASDATLIIVGGGDGTLRSAAGRLAGTDRTLGILPLGTLNLLARDLGLPLDPVEAARLLGQAAERRIDLGEVNGEVFACQSVLGMPNAVGRHRQAHRRQRSLLSRLRVIAGIVRAMGQPPLRLGMVVAGESRVRRVWARALSVVNNPYESGVGQLFHRPTLDGGTLAIYRPRRFGLFWALLMMLAMALGRWREMREVDILHAPAVTLRSRRKHLRVMNDGEMLMLATPLRYRILPRALRVLAPRA
ncbi:diacylglycerol/lipid kinase family protein [Roseomonas sp. BN140053]|uniref:diacylglycerol/lipid kinase family protein n=1 Tax=Roseomonas sp. BN140053 TaxID=3391898 RepID=UPI0039EABD54